jgi:hypothetical protein
MRSQNEVMKNKWSSRSVSLCHQKSVPRNLGCTGLNETKAVFRTLMSQCIKYGIAIALLDRIESGSFIVFLDRTEYGLVA